MILAGDKTMKSKHATARLALTLALGCLLGVGLMFGGAACQQPTGGDGGPAAGEIGGACLDGTCTEGFCLATNNTCVRCFEEGVACTNSEQCCEGLECVDGECAEAAPCESNDDCPDGQICENGECVEAPPVPCEANEDCDDGLYCNGVETCVEEVCQAGTDPCEEGQTCDEETDTCVAGAVESPYAEAVAFDHDSHMTAEGLVCTDCHHAEPNAAGQSCDTEGCHADEWLGGVPKLKEAQHWTCRTCHDARAGEAVRCDTCHTALKDL